MGLNRFFFRTRLLQAQDLERLSNAARRARQRGARINKEHEQRFKTLEEDLGYVSLVLGAVLQKLDQAGTLKRADVQAIMGELDGIDGVLDGRMDVGILKASVADEA